MHLLLYVRPPAQTGTYPVLQMHPVPRSTFSAAWILVCSPLNLQTLGPRLTSADGTGKAKLEQGSRTKKNENWAIHAEMG